MRSHRFRQGSPRRSLERRRTKAVLSAREAAAPARPHFRCNRKGILFALLSRLDTGLSFDPSVRREKRSMTMAITTLKVLASLLQLHGPGATIQSDHQGIDALLSDLRGQGADPVATEVAFRRGAFAKGAGAGAFRRAGYAPRAGAFRRGGFIR